MRSSLFKEKKAYWYYVSSLLFLKVSRMVATLQIIPAGLLSQFVLCYALRTFGAGDKVFTKPLDALNDCYLSFLFRDKVWEINNEGKSKKSYWSGNLYALCTESWGCTYFKGNFIFLNIQLKELLVVIGIPRRMLLNTNVRTENVLHKQAALICQQLHIAKDIHEMSRVLDNYRLLNKTQKKQTNYANILIQISDQILQNKGTGSIDYYATQANMSVRNFERRFMEETGMPPKLFMRLTRFCQALENKTLSPEKSWTTICLEAGYFDQAHFIKECRQFSSQSPQQLFTQTSLPVKNKPTR